MKYLARRLILRLRPNSAYLDPGSGSYVLQLLIAGILGSLFLLRGYIGRIRSFITGLFTADGDEEDPET